MSLCKECRNLISIIDNNRIQCEAHLFSINAKSKCKAYINSKNEDEKKRKYNNKIVSEIHSYDVETICSS